MTGAPGIRGYLFDAYGTLFDVHSVVEAGRASGGSRMSQSTWGFSQWLLLILAAVAVAAYFGALGSVVDTLEDKVEVVEKKISQRVEKSQAGVRAKLERVGKHQKVEETFVDTETAWVDALVVLSLFIFITPIAVIMAMVLVLFVLSAIAHMLPIPDGAPHRAAVVVLAAGLAVVIYVLSSAWVPYMQYYAAWVARAYVVVTSG